MKKILSLALLFLVLLSCSTNTLHTEVELKRSDITELVVYTNPRCGYCHRLETFLKAENVPFTRKDITSDQKAYEEFQELGGRGTPLSILKTKSEDKLISGYNLIEFERIAAAYD